MQKLINFAVCLTYALASATAAAQSSNRYQKAERLADVVGLVASFEEVKKAYAAQSREQMNQLAEPFQRIGASAEVIAEVNRLASEYDRTVTESFDTREAAAAYVKALAESLSEAELGRAIKYYESPEGKRVNEAVIAASVRLSEYVEARVRPAQQLAMKKFVDAVIALRQKLPPPPKQ